MNEAKRDPRSSSPAEEAELRRVRGGDHRRELEVDATVGRGKAQHGSEADHPHERHVSLARAYIVGKGGCFSLIG
jgi:hypothetical protein